MNFLQKIALRIKNPVAVGVGGRNKISLRMIEEVLNNNLDQRVSFGPDGFFELMRTDVLIFEIDERADEVFAHSKRPILVGTAAGNIPPRSEVFAASQDKVGELFRLAGKLPHDALMLVNYDDETVREIVEHEDVDCNFLEYGLGKGAEIRASDIKIGEKGTSFKLNYQGNTVPVWLKNRVGKRQIYATLASCALGVNLGLNLVDVTQSLKVYEGVKGEGQLIPGVKKTRILDDSANADPFSMDETLMLLSEIKKKARGSSEPEIRKIAVLGDILKVGEYAVEAHQAMGEKAAENVDILFTVGPRAKFIGNEAEINGLDSDNIHHFIDEKEAAKAVEEEMEPSDLILVDGAAEMKMEAIVEEIRKR